MGKCQVFAGGQIRLNALFIEFGLFFIVDQDHDDIRGLGSVKRCHDLESGLLRFGPGFASLIQSDDDINAAVFQIQRVGVSLTSVSDDRYLFAFQQS